MKIIFQIKEKIKFEDAKRIALIKKKTITGFIDTYKESDCLLFKFEQNC